MSRQTLALRAHDTTGHILRMLAVLLFVAIGSVFVSAPQAHAGGGVGTGGGSTGGYGGAHTTNGWGWYKFTTDSSYKPRATMRNGDPWSDVNKVCHDANANSIYAFLILDTYAGAPPPDHANWGVVYKYESFYDPYAHHMSGGNWVSTSTAKARFNNLGTYGVSTSGFTWGSNVAWFCYDYQPTDTWKITGSSSVDRNNAAPGDKMTWTHRLRKTGTGTHSIAWRVQRSNVPIGSSRSWTSVKNNSWTPGSTRTITSSYTAGVGDVGHEICERIRWSPTAYNNSGATNGTPRCVVVSIVPLVQVWGNDLRVGSALSSTSNKNSRIVGSTLKLSGTTGGSWTEYGVFAPSSISRMASGSGLVNSTSSLQKDWSNLTFANNGSYGGFAAAQSMGVLPDIPDYFDSLNDSKLTKQVVNNTSVGSYQANKVIIASGTVTINGNITAPDTTVNSDSDLTQMVIIARNINIHQNVKRIDAWLIAPTGTINTCSNQSGNLSTSVCNDQLTITGPIEASHLTLRRTFNNAAGDPAEIMNLRSDSYLWALNRSKKNQVWATNYVTELPPRY